MTAELRISPRERLILTAILEMYIATGEPVASQAVARIYADKEGMSSATIRNVMVSLSDSDGSLGRMSNVVEAVYTGDCTVANTPAAIAQINPVARITQRCRLSMRR